MSFHPSGGISEGPSANRPRRSSSPARSCLLGRWSTGRRVRPTATSKALSPIAHNDSRDCARTAAISEGASAALIGVLCRGGILFVVGPVQARAVACRHCAFLGYAGKWSFCPLVGCDRRGGSRSRLVGQAVRRVTGTPGEFGGLVTNGTHDIGSPVGHAHRRLLTPFSRPAHEGTGGGADVLRFAGQIIRRGGDRGARSPIAGKQKPSDTDPDYHERQRVLPDFPSHIAKKIARRAVASVVDHLVDYTSGGHPIPQLFQSSG